MWYSPAIISSIVMLVLGIAGNLGIYEGAVDMMAAWHMFFSLSFAGIIGGMVEAAIKLSALYSCTSREGSVSLKDACCV